MLVEHDALLALHSVRDLVDWHQIEGMLSRIHTKIRGEKAWPPLLMFKALRD